MALDNTHYGYEKINEMIGSSPKRIFFSGVGGVSMSSLAKVCVMRGHEVTGYDRSESDLTRKISEEGVRVVYESLPKYADGADIIVYTVAMSADDPVIKRAGELGRPLISRADFSVIL